jgi:hypothetical protein
MQISSFIRHFTHILQQVPGSGLVLQRVGLLPCSIYAIATAFFLFSRTAGLQAAHLVGALFCGVVWIGVRHLSLTNFAPLTGFFVKGPFRRIIHLQSRLEEFERSLANAGDIQQCWETIQVDCRDFGFCGGRLSVRGRVYETAALPTGLAGQWQLRVPLAQAQYLNLYRDPEAEDHPAILGRLAGILRDGLQAQLRAR